MLTHRHTCTLCWKTPEADKAEAWEAQEEPQLGGGARWTSCLGVLPQPADELKVERAIDSQTLDYLLYTMLKGICVFWKFCPLAQK